MSFTWGDLFSDMKISLCKVFCCKCGKDPASYLSKSELMFQKGYNRLERDLMNYDVLKCIKKFKASLSFVIDEDHECNAVKKKFV